MHGFVEMHFITKETLITLALNLLHSESFKYKYTQQYYTDLINHQRESLFKPQTHLVDCSKHLGMN